jgi:GMP reductase
MKETIEYFKENLPKTKIIAGNVATQQAVRDLSQWGADAVKVGIGQGSPCTTKNKTGFTMPMFSCVKRCSGTLAGDTVFDDCGSNAHDYESIPIVADGGIKYNGDIAKAVVAGADFVMAGSIFASCVDSSAKEVEVDGVWHKAYFGSASFENKKIKKNVEGKLKKLPQNGMCLKEKLSEIEQDLQSAISYGGGESLKDLSSVNYEVV